jgi:hypothetical protein
MYTTQDVAALVEHVRPADAGGDPLLAGCARTGLLTDGACAGLIPRSARLFTSQVHLSLQRPRLRAELEGAFVYGTLGVTDERRDTPSAKTIVAGGAAGRLYVRRGHGELRLDLGFATGEGEGGFGVLDSDNFHGTASDSEDAPLRKLLTGFRFHRDFRVDGLLFRDLVGAVANAVYVRPAWRVHLIERGARDGLWLEPGVMLAAAAWPDATPGRARWLGVEPEFQARWTAGGSELGLHATWLLPGAGLAAEDGSAAAPAWRLAASWRLRW